MDEFRRFSDLPEPLRAAIFVMAWRDKAAWHWHPWGTPARKQLRLVCRQARATIDGVIEGLKYQKQGIEELILEATAMKVLTPFLSSGRFLVLRDLRVAWTSFGDAAVRVLAQTAWPRLETLMLELSELTHEGVAALAAASATRLPMLRCLQLNWNYFEDAGVKALMQGHWSCLKELELSHTDIGVDAAAALAAASRSQSIPRLETLLLAGNDLGPDAVVALLQPAPWASLQTLDLSGNELYAEGAAELAAFSRSQLPVLRKLVLGVNETCKASFAAVAEGHWHHLEVLDYFFCEDECPEVDHDEYNPHCSCTFGLAVDTLAAAGRAHFPALRTVSFSAAGEEINVFDITRRMK